MVDFGGGWGPLSGFKFLNFLKVQNLGLFYGAGHFWSLGKGGKEWE